MILLLLAAIGISTCYKNEGIGMSFNRSEIHIRIDLNSKDGNSEKGKHVHLSKGENVEQLENKDDENDTASMSSKTENKRKEEKDLKWKEGSKYKTELNQNRNRLMRKSKKGKKLKKATNSMKNNKKQRKKAKNNKKQGKNRVNNINKLKGRHEKEKNKAEDKVKMNKKRKGKKVEQNIRMRKQNKEDQVKAFRLKERKKGKMVKNPEGSPNPNDLKIPLTFGREIGNEGNNSMETANQTNIVAKEGKTKSHEERKSDENGSKGQTGKEKSPRETTNQWDIDSNIRNFTKQIIISTLKEITSIRNTTGKVDKSKDVNQGPSNPLMERMVSDIMLVAIGNR